ncbi:MAG: SpoIIE family protein phosphatase [Acidimicrobiales bacterium]|nr:SpoIIE family protein phosphatase [Acidimicrobiales bacterium]
MSELSDLADEYQDALVAYVKSPDESGRAHAYELGSRAVRAGVGLLDLVAVHQAGVAGFPGDPDMRRLVVSACDFLRESLTTYEMTQSGYREAQERAAIAHDIALTLQRSLLPGELPAPPGLELAVRYLPAGPDVEVGGDWYDLVELGGRRVGLVVGDVMGHGIHQAAAMGQLRLGLRAYLLEHHPIDEVVRRTDVLLQSLGDVQTATMVLAVVDLAVPTLSLVNAGHPAPVLIDPSGAANFVTGGHGRLLGLRRDQAQPVLDPLPLAPGSSILLYTDGLIDGYERAGADGLEHLRLTLDGFSGSPDELCDHVTEEMIDGERGDDVCLLAVRVAGQPDAG